MQSSQWEFEGKQKIDAVDYTKLYSSVGGNIYCKCSTSELSIAEEIDGSLVADI